MAEVATKKSINVVSSKKNEVCGVQSNNGLIDLDDLTASNNQLISLNDDDDDDDLVLTNNTRNELDNEDKSLQELIESELALRICSSKSDDDIADELEVEQPVVTQPETIKRIVLDRRQDPVDINAEFIAAESEHYSLIEEPHQNGHVSPDANTKVVKPEPVFHDKEAEQVFVEQPEVGAASIIVQKTCDDDCTSSRDEAVEEHQAITRDHAVPATDVLDSSNVTNNFVDISQLSETCSANKEKEPAQKMSDDADLRRTDVNQENTNADVAQDTRTEQRSLSSDQQFSDFDEGLCQQIRDSDEQKFPSTNKETSTKEHSLTFEQFTNCVKSSLKPSFSQNKQSPSKIIEEADPKLSEKHKENPRCQEQSGSFDDGITSQSEMFTETINMRELPPSVCAKCREEADQGTPKIMGMKEFIDRVGESIRAGYIPKDKQSPSKIIEEADSKLSQKHDEELECSDDGITSQSEMFTETINTREFLATERRVLSEEADQGTSKIMGMKEYINRVEACLRERYIPWDKESPSKIIEEADSKLSQKHDEELECSDDDIASRSEMFTETTGTRQRSSDITGSPATPGSILESESVPEGPRDVAEENPVDESSSELSASDSTFIEKTEVVVSDTSVTIYSETKRVVDENLDSWTTVEEATKSAASVEEEKRETERSGNVNEEKADDSFAPPASPRAPLATPDETETSDVSNACDSESREETVTASSTVVTSSKVGTKTKKKKIEGVSGNDATSPNLTPRTKKTKKSKKSDLEKENISVTQNYVSETSRSDQEKLCRERIATGVSIKQLCRSFGDISNMSDGDQAAFGKTSHAMETEEKARSMGDLRLCEQGYSRFAKDAPVFAGVSVKALRASYCSLASLTSEGKDKDRACERPKLEKSSFNKFDALTKKTVLHVRSVDAGKVQQQLNAVGQSGDANTNCRSCGKVVFQMEQTKAEGLVWHKNCFRCVQCGKQLNVDNYESHESTLYCKPHFKELFQPKPVEESEQPASDKPDLGLEELSSLNVKSRFQVFEKASTENVNEIERSPSQIAVKRSPSILSKLAKFQAKGMDIGVADESLNGIPYEESSESEDDVETEETEEVETEIVKAKRTTRERPISFSKMDDIKNRWESTSQQGRREIQREARKEEIAGIRSRLFMGKQGKMKEMYQQAVAGNDRVTKINAAEEIQHSTAHARSIKERFERGEPIATSDDEIDSKPKPEKADEEVIAAGISRKSRSLFLELDASAAKTGRPVTPVHPKTPTEIPRRARDMDSPDREIYRDPDVVRANDRVDEVVHTDTARKMLSIFRQMEENACKEELPDGPKPLKCFTPPPEDKFAKATASDSEENEDEENEESDGDESAEEKDPNYVRASDKVEDEFLKQAQNAARAKTLRAKFEHWEETDGKVSSHHIAEMEMAQGTGEQSSIESASSLRARFESLGSQSNESPRAPKVKVNRFVEIQTSCTDVCESCQKKVYPLEKVETNNKIFHKQCFRCLQCNCILRMDSFTLNNGKLYCIPHFKQLFITRGNYDEGFGVDPHKNKWATTNSNSSTSPSPIAVSNGDL